MADDDDDFEDLFSFGATTPVAAPSAPSAKPPPSTGSDFDLLSDVSLSSPGAGGAAAPSAASATPRSAGGDEFDSLFGTPPATPATAPRTPLDMSAAEKDALLSIDESPSGKLQSTGVDDFHVHDEETRDMLDWLDDDHAAKKAKDEPASDFLDLDLGLGDDAANDVAPAPNEDEGFGDDDFDFDSMLAEADSAPSPTITTAKKEQVDEAKETPPSTKPPETKPQVVPEVAKPSEDDVTEIKLETAEVDAAPKPPPPVPLPVQSSIEDELAFDQWEDDENEEEMEDLQLATDSGEASEGKASETDATGAINVNDALSSEKKEGGEAVVKPPSPKKITFSSLSDAIRSNASNVDDVRSLFNKECGPNNLGGNVGVSKEDRAHLWTKIICGKILGDIEDGSLADSYREWEKKGEVKFDDEESGETVDALLRQTCSISKDDEGHLVKKHQLLSLSHFHHSRNNKASSPVSHSSIDPLIPPVALAVLEAGVPPAAASVVLSHIEPSCMPLLRLSHDERYLAAKALHADFYLLACYHLPLLVMHLDRHCPGWYWPRREDDIERQEGAGPADDAGAVKDGDDSKDAKATSKPEADTEPVSKKQGDLERNGLIPLSWFVTNFAGECGRSSMDHTNLLPLWDNILIKGDHSWKYFLAIATLEKNSDVLLMARGDDLKLGFKKILDFDEAEFTAESFVGASEGGDSSSNDDMVSEWLSSAKSLIDATPSSAVELLRSADDRAVASALKVRQTKMEEELQAQLDAEEDARRKEKNERDKVEEKALNKARLTAYYREVAPEKIDTIDKILKLFDGRIPVLNEKLKTKYGKGFLPEEDVSQQTRSFLLSVNQSINVTRKHVSVAVAERRKKKAKSSYEARPQTKVVLEVSTTEVVPVICTTKGHNLATGKKMVPTRRTSETDSALEFYLVDCRPESIAAEQGRFPTAVQLSPEKLQDPDELQKLTDMFESLRSAVHICVMGEGFASFPVLYNHKLSSAEQKLLEDDIARTSNCALFFLKKGFPFVSILRGGFAAAHAFLSRNGPSMGMAPEEVLVDYDPSLSLFSQLETARQEEERLKNAPAREKTAKSLQRIIDNSMTRLTIEEQRINSLANDLAKPETVDKMKQSARNLLDKAKPKTVPSIGFGRTPPLFMSKRFPTTASDGAPVQKTDAAQGDSKGKTASLSEKISFKLPSLHSESSSTALSDKEASESDANEMSKTPGLEPPSSVSPDEGDNGGTASESRPKISSAFTSISQRMQQSTKAPAADVGESSTESDVSAKENTGSKMTFSSFTSRLKQATEAKVSEEAKATTTETTAPDSSSDKENDEKAATDNAPKAPSSTFASLSQRMQQATIAGTRLSGSGQPTAEGEPAKKEAAASKISFSSFTNRIKLSQQPVNQPLKSPDESAGGENETPDEEKNASTSEIGEVDPKASASTESATDGGRFSSFSKSFGGSLSGLRERAAAAKVPVEKGTAEKGNDEPAAGVEPQSDRAKGDAPDGGRFTSFSFGSLSARQSQFSTYLKTKQEPAGAKKATERGEPDSVANALSSMEKSSLGKLLLKDEPRPKTRFQRQRLEDAEESISFDVTASTTESHEGGLNDLFLGLDSQPHGDPTQGLFADISLDGDEQKATNESAGEPPATAAEEKPADTTS